MPTKEQFDQAVEQTVTGKRVSKVKTRHKEVEFENPSLSSLLKLQRGYTEPRRIVVASMSGGKGP